MSRTAVQAAHRLSDPAPAASAPSTALRLVSSDSACPDAEAEDLEALEASLLAFDPAEDIENVVPMPPSISRALRHALTRAYTRRFEHYAELDAWLHLPHPALAGRTPFERLVDGDGAAVLRALLGARASGARRAALRSGASRSLHLMR